MAANPATELANDIYNAFTGRNAQSLSANQRDALKAGLALTALAVDALMRIADAADKMAPTRPVHDPLDGL